MLWVRAESVELLVSDFLSIAVLLDLPEQKEQDERKVVSAVLRWLDTHESWLLILDNADHLAVVRPFLPSLGKGHVLLTTRAFSTGTVAERIELETMKVEEGMHFLLRRIKRIQGHIDIPLAEAGLAQAQKLARRIADDVKHGARLDAIYSSDLQRARQTAR